MSPYQLFIGGTLLATGLMCIVAAALNLDAFMNHPKAEQFVRSMGRTGARIFYVILGLVVAVLGAGILAWNYL